MSESAESDNETDSPSKPDKPSSPVFGASSANAQVNGHVSHTCSKGKWFIRKKRIIRPVNDKGKYWIIVLQTSGISRKSGALNVRYC